LAGHDGLPNLERWRREFDYGAHFAEPDRDGDHRLYVMRKTARDPGSPIKRVASRPTPEHFCKLLIAILAYINVAVKIRSDL
jgi:hypothetical protein